ncbi:MAG TPA: hypothetical protein VFU62_09395 [Hanamia sp.]|jgi:hypothetical protein|nr:hypothetical protein [Hanamia sp.]
METRTRNMIVFMPNDSLLEVSYYCSDKMLNEEEKKLVTQLVIQLADCICSLKIDRSFSANKNALERIVHNKVINTKGHLC